MTITKNMEQFFQQFHEDFPNHDGNVLKLGDVDYLKISAPIIAMFGYPKYMQIRRWWYLLAIGLRVIFAAVITPIKLQKRKQPISTLDATKNLLIVCNTFLAFRELYIPLMKSDGQKLVFLFTSLELEKKCITMAGSVGLHVKTVAHHSVLASIFTLCRDVSLLVIKTFKLKSKDSQQYKRKIFLVYYSLFTSFPFLCYIACFKYSIQNNNYESLVVDDATDISVRAMIELAKSKKIQTNILQFGHYDIESIGWGFVNANTVYVWGDFYKNLIQNNFKCSDVAIHTLGSPRFDYLFKKNTTTLQDREKKTILILSACTINNYELIACNSAVEILKKDVVTTLAKYVKEKNIRIIVKPHPYETDAHLQIWRSLSSNHGIILEKSDDIRAIIASTHVVISFGSGLSLDCLVAGIPTIFPNWVANYPWECQALIKAGCITANTMSQFTHFLETSLEKESALITHKKKHPIRHFIQQEEAISEKLLYSLANKSCERELLINSNKEN